MVQPSPLGDLLERRPVLPEGRHPGIPMAMKPMNQPSRRVSTAQIAQALDEIVGTRRLEHPYTLYRYIAHRTGVHPTTVLRYHTGYLKSVPANVYTHIRKLLELVRRGQALPFENKNLGNRATGRMSPTGRVPATAVRKGLGGVFQYLGLREHQVLYRYLAERVGLHPTTVLRYYRGYLQTAPAALVAEIDFLRGQIVRGEVVLFRQGPDGSPVVLREQTRSIVEEFLATQGTAAEPAETEQLDIRLDLPPGTTGRIRFDAAQHFVPVNIHRAIEQFVHGVEYDPIRTFHVGQRVRHHLFGPGTVREKIHKNRVRIEFLDGKQVVLAEAVPEDPYRYQRMGGGEVWIERGKAP